VAPIYADLLRLTARGKQQVDGLIEALGWPPDRHRGYGHLDRDLVRSLAVDVARAHVSALADQTMKAGVYHVLLAHGAIAEGEVAVAVAELRRVRYIWRVRELRAFVAAAFSRRDYVAALRAARRAIRHRAEFRQAHALAGFALLRQGRGRATAAHFDKAASLQRFEPAPVWAPIPPVRWKRAILRVLARWDMWRSPQPARPQPREAGRGAHARRR